ncbi:MAG: sulfotransferase [Rhodospirillaceae bacterium]|nr:sulfotransferase [Rhodospirillaceae bacterium]
MIATPAVIRTRFFVFGLPKSGTTWLQMLLDAHPAVSCPSEHQISHFLEALPKLINDYNIVLKEIDRRTANQGATLLVNDDLLAITRTIVDRAIASGARRKNAPIAGLKDNTLVSHLALFRELYPDAQLLCIVRDPRDTALSSWHHNNRVEAGFRDRAPDFASWAGQTWTRWTDLYRAALALDDPRRSLLMLRYEDLTGTQREAALAGVLAHLGAANDPALLDRLFSATDLDRLRSGAAAPFYRAGRAGGWSDAPEASAMPLMSPEMLRLMAHFGYPAGA